MSKQFTHPFLLGLFPLLSLFQHNLGEVSFSEILVPTAVILSFALILLFLSALLIKDSEKAAIVVSIFFVLSFSYGHVYDLIDGSQIGKFTIGRHRVLMVTWGILLAAGSYFVVKRRRKLRNVTSILNIVSAALVLISVINILVYKVITNSEPWEDIKRPENLESIVSDSKNPIKSPDIYYIILDRYASAPVLKENYDFNNREFVDYLSSHGFYVASQSRSNYLVTAHSLASSLNMEFINYLSDKMGEDSNNWIPLFGMIEDNKVWRLLKAKGYKFIHFGSRWQPTIRNKYADANFNLYPMPEFSKILFQTTIFHPISYRLFHFGDIRREKWERIMYVFEKLGEMPNIKEPTFVFAHILLPHEPYVFDRNGKFLSKDEEKIRNREVNYLEQLIFANKKVMLLIDTLLSKSEVRPIIILQGDEGPYPQTARTNDFNWVQASPGELKEKMGILNAYYFPDTDKNVLYPTITPVNSFRLIFNLYFNTNLELLPDESYAFVDRNHLYKFVNVTEKLK